MKDILVLIDNGHGVETPGKCSPDKRLREYRWARHFASMLDRRLTLAGVSSMRVVPEETDVSITERCRRVNGWCAKRGAKNVLLISIHCNAGPDIPSAYDKNPKDEAGYWKTARGFSVYVSKSASAESKRFAAILTNEAVTRKLTGNRSIPPQRYWTWPLNQRGDIGILRGTRCPAVLTENLFQDNREDVEFLLSEEGMEHLLDLHMEAIRKYFNS